MSQKFDVDLDSHTTFRVENTVEEIAEAMRQDPEGWAELYLQSLEVIDGNFKAIKNLRMVLELHNINIDPLKK